MEYTPFTTVYTYNNATLSKTAQDTFLLKTSNIYALSTSKLKRGINYREIELQLLYLGNAFV